MSDALAAFFVLGLIWALVTVLGHGTWVLLARLFGTRPTPSPDDRIANPRDAMRALQEQLARFATRRVIDAETHAAVRTAIESQQRRLAERSAKPVAIAPVPLAPAPVADDVVLMAVNESASPPIAPVVPIAPVQPPATPATPAERVRSYAGHRAAAAAEPVVGTAPVAPKKREATSRLLAAFMEEKNIRWGELVGGLLIVGCSVALVISFWSEIAARPFLKFVLFNGVTAALFGVGLYTDRRWKIHTTSHGLLVIATLLVPLNFLAIAAFTQGAAANDALTLVGEAVSAVVFTLLVYLAARIVAPGEALPLVAGVMVPSLMQLLIRRWADPSTALTTLYALAAVPVVAYVTTTSLVARRWAREPAHEEPAALRLLTFLGVASAAAFLPLALLVWKAQPVEDAIHRLSPLAVWCGVPALVVGLLFWRRMTERRLSSVQTAGLAVGVLGAAIMGGAVVAAWPDPATLLPVALMNVVAFAVVAFWFGIPAALVPAGLALAAAWLVVFHVARGNVGWTVAGYEPMQRALVSAMSGHALVPLVGVFGILIGMLRQVGRREEGRMIALVAAITAAASLCLVMWFGFARAGDPEGVTWTLGIYAIASLAAATLTPRPAVAWVGAALLLLALVQGIVFRWNDALGLARPGIVALLAHATLMVLALALAAWRRGPPHLWVTFRWWAAVSSVAAAGLLVAAATTTPTAALAQYSAWLAAVWFGLALLTGWAVVFAAAQIAAALAIFAGVLAAVETREWYVAARHPWLDPWFVQAQGLALAAFCLVFGVVRALFARIAARRSEFVIEAPAPGWFATGHRLLGAPWPGVDQLLEVALVVMFAMMAVYAAVPGAAQELAPLEAARGDGPTVRVVAPIANYEWAGISQAHAADRGAWFLGAAVVAAVAVGLWQRRHSEARAWALLLVLAMACPLLAARWAPEVAVASALRWLSAGFFALASIAIWIAQAKAAVNLRRVRDGLVVLIVFMYAAMGAYVAGAALARTAMPVNAMEFALWALAAGVVAIAIPSVIGTQSVGAGGRRAGDTLARAQTARGVLLLLAFAPLAILFAFAVAKALDQHPIVGPELGSWFRRIGWDVTYGVPLAVIALAFVGHAIVYRSSGFAFAAGLLANVVATIVLLLKLARGGGTLDAAAWITVAQVNAIVVGVVAIVWLAAVRWKRARDPLLLVTQVALAAALCAAFLLPAAVRLAFEPANIVPWLIQAGGKLGWTAFALAAVAAGWLHGRQAVRQSTVAFFAMLLVAIVALARLPWDTGNWLAVHTLIVGCCVAAWLVPVVTAVINRLLGHVGEAAVLTSWSAFSARIFGITAIVLALRALDGDPASPWWTIGALAAIGARNVWIAWREGGRGSMWIAAILCNIAVTIWCTRGRIAALDFLWINVITAAAMAVVSAVVERRIAAWRTGPSFHRFAAWAIVVVMLLAATVGLFADLDGHPIQNFNWPLAWAAWLASFVAAAVGWWDPRSRWPVACIYTVGLVAVGMYLDGLNFQAPMFHWALAMALAAYSLATSFLWSRRAEIAALLARLRVPISTTDWSTGGGHRWLIAVNGLSAVAVLALVAWTETALPEFRQRMIAAYAVGAEALAIALLARGAVRSSLQYTALVFGALFAVAFGWAFLPPDMPAPWLHRTVAAIAALAATIVVYGVGFAKLLRKENEWTRAAERLVSVLAVIAAALLLVVLGIEVAAFAEGRAVPITWPALLAVAIALVGLAVVALAAALVPGRDPLGLSERGRTVYVYVAEALAALTFLHIRVTMPWLFRGWFLQFWPLVVMGIAFVGVGLGEVFRRRRQNVLSEPLMTTGALLPLLPALGFWVTSSEVHYSLLLLTVGVLYAAVSALRQSFWFAVLAAVAANGSLWFLLHEHEGLSIADHPQLWLIPPALCVLVAGYLNRERLSPEQSAALRYGSAIVIYASSTADIFINGVADAPWLPAVLAGLSIAGVFAGILLRVRAFLYLGVTFLLVALMTVIWYAAVEQQRTWILWVAGIVTGVAIIALFGVFEKRRDDVLRMVERLKQWEA